MVYNVTTAPTFANWGDGLTIVLRANAAGTGNDEVSLNSSLAYPIYKYSSSAINVPTAVGDILAGGLYLLIWDAVQVAWILT